MSAAVLVMTHLLAALAGILAGVGLTLSATSKSGKVSALWLHELRRNEDRP